MFPKLTSRLLSFLRCHRWQQLPRFRWQHGFFEEEDRGTGKSRLAYRCLSLLYMYCMYRYVVCLKVPAFTTLHPLISHNTPTTTYITFPPFTQAVGSPGHHPGLSAHRIVHLLAKTLYNAGPLGHIQSKVNVAPTINSQNIVRIVNTKNTIKKKKNGDESDVTSNNGGGTTCTCTTSSSTGVMEGGNFVHGSGKWTKQWIIRITCIRNGSLSGGAHSPLCSLMLSLFLFLSLYLSPYSSSKMMTWLRTLVWTQALHSIRIVCGWVPIYMMYYRFRRS